MDGANLVLPPLPEQYVTPLNTALRYIFAEFEPFAVVVSGSIIRGNPDPASDFDILVVHGLPWRRRVQKFFAGVPTEIFVNSPAWMQRYFIDEEAEGRPIMAHMLTFGVVVYSSSEETGRLIATAQASLARGAHFSDFALTQRRYTAACLFEDAIELAARDEAGSALLLSRAVDAALHDWFAARQRLSVRPKDQFRQVLTEDPETARLMQAAMTAHELDARLEAAHQLALRVLGVTGFFEWDSGRDDGF